MLASYFRSRISATPVPRTSVPVLGLHAQAAIALAPHWRLPVPTAAVLAVTPAIGAGIVHTTGLVTVMSIFCLTARASMPHIRAILRELNIRTVIAKVSKKELTAEEGKDFVHDLTRFEGGKAGSNDDWNNATPADAVPHKVRSSMPRQAQGRARPKAPAGNSDVKSA
jgi:hypothetical protein